MIKKRSITRGLTLVELLVAIVIGMIAVLVLMQVAVNFEGQKRAAVGTAGAMDEGAAGLFALRREIQTAGYGIVDPDLIGCVIAGHSQLEQCGLPGAPPPGNYFAFRIVPILIAQGAGSQPDSISVNYSNSPMIVSAARLQRGFNGDEGLAASEEEKRFKLSNAQGFNPGDTVILANRAITYSGSNMICSRYELTGQVGADEFEHKFGCYTKPAELQPDSTKYNRNGGLYPVPGSAAPLPVPGLPALPDILAGVAPNYPVGTKVFNLGNNATSINLSVVGSNLVSASLAPLPGATQTTLFENVISFQAQYGFDARPGAQATIQVPSQNYAVGVGGFSDNIEDVNGDGTTGDREDWLRLGAVRVAIIVRNKYPERPDPVSGLCATTANPPSWSWGSTTVAVMAASLPDWQCYRYKSFETVIPLRNMIWKPPT